MAKGSSKYKHPPMSPRGRALEALSGHGGNAAGDAYETYQQVVDAALKVDKTADRHEAAAAHRAALALKVT